MSTQPLALLLLLQKEQFITIGHRGAAGLAPENTMPGFKLALDHGCRMLELDVHRLRDSTAELAVIHDEKLTRTTGDKRLIQDLTVTDLAHLDAGNGAKVPTLSEVLVLLKEQSANQVWLNVELKGADTASVTHSCLQANPYPHLVISSFDHEQLFAYRALDPICPIAPLLHHWQKDIHEIGRELGAVCINLSRRIATQKRIHQLREAGFFVLVYTVNSVSEARRLFQYGASGVFTDFPDRVSRDVIVVD